MSPLSVSTLKVHLCTGSQGRSEGRIFPTARVASSSIHPSILEFPEEARAEVCSQVLGLGLHSETGSVGTGCPVPVCRAQADLKAGIMGWSLVAEATG